LRTSVIWLRISDYGLGNLAGGWGIHDIDIAQWVNDADNTLPVTTEGTGTLYDDIRDTIATYDIEHTYANGVKIKFMDGATARRQFNQFGPANSDLLIGTEGWIWVSRQGMKTYPESLMKSTIGPNEIHVIRSSDHRGNLINAIRTGEPNVSPVDIAWRAEMICQAGDIAVRLKRKLNWDIEKAVFIDDEQANKRLSKPMRSPWRFEVPDAAEKS
jgi:predicted dehydrogenase